MSFHPETSALASLEPSKAGQRGSLSVTDCSTVRPRALDLFCCAGGAGMGLHRAGFDVHGVDIEPQPNYPFAFTQGDALAQDLTGYDFVWASPPCQAHTPLKHRTGKEYECFIERTRAKLKAWGGPYIIENVMGAPLINPVMLCGAMFPPLRVYRHRIFESNVALAVPPHPKHVVPCAPQRQRKAAFAAGKFVTVTGDIGRYAGEAMGIDWATGNEMSQAIPPAYSEFLGRQILQTLTPGQSNVEMRDAPGAPSQRHSEHENTK